MRLAAELAPLDEQLRLIGEVDPNRAPSTLSRLVHGRLLQALRSITGDDPTPSQLALANAVLALLEREAPDSGIDHSDQVEAPLRELLAVLERTSGPAQPMAPPRPRIPLSTSDLLVNGPHDLRLGTELQLELASADRVDVLCSFLKWSGLRIVEEQLHAFCARRGGSALRVITTAYMRATERRALDALREMGADLRVSYDTDKTRLHAKAWLLHRDSGYSTAFVGSSNMSAAAMVDGAEWNVRLSAVDNRAILAKFESTFEQYWLDTTYLPYVAEEFDKAVMTAQRAQLAPYLAFDVEPRTHQREILEDLAAERLNGHMRNLVVAATGTGKTIVAALDYKRLRKELPRDRLLFVAHRKEILDQSLTTFQVVLRDGAFGETLVGGQKPVRWEHVFASIQSLHEEQLEQIPPDHYDVVIVDEFHHAAAETYRKLLDRLRPRVLLGLTATPERSDGKSVLGWFDGRVASELRLGRALDQGLLSPFQYFGLGGAPNVSGIKWSGGRYDSKALSNVYTADHAFALRVLQETAHKVTDIQTMQALGFCVDVAHAEFMAGRFTKAGIASVAVSATTPSAERAAHLRALAAGELRCVFSVDLFNEGVDLPDVDTVLFLRPTESATVFLQQLGRGLRRSERKECLTVLDFIGDAHRRFRFDLRYRAIVGGTRRSIAREIEAGFPTLPSGCSIQLDRQAQRAVLENIERQVGVGAQHLIEDLRSMLGESSRGVRLADFLREADVDLEDVYASKRCWTTLRRAAGAPVPPPGPDDEQIERALSRMLHVDDRLRLTGFRELLAQPAAPAADDSDPIQRLLFALLGYAREPLGKLPQAWGALWASPALRDELLQLLDELGDRSRALTLPLAGHLAVLPLQVHARYSLDEVLTGVDERNKHGGIKRIQTGVYYIERLGTDLLFVTLEKSAKEYSPTTLYNDYAISPKRFHWETQSSCHPDTGTGQRYIRTRLGSGNQALLFVRTRRNDERGETMPYTLLGEAYCASHRGARPMQIEWDLRVPMPAGFFQEAKLAAG